MDSHLYTDSPFQLPSDSLLILHRKFRVFQDLTQDFPATLGKDISKKERSENSLSNASLTYGEVEFLSLGETFEIIKAVHGEIKPGGIFYDLGSGSGKGVISAALLHNFTKCVGIEILQGLFAVSERLKTNYDQIRLSLMEENRDLWQSLPDVEFVNGDLFRVDWSDADVIFMNSTCFDIGMMDAIAMCQVKAGTWGITLTKSLASSKWKVVQSFRKRMSWGEATVYIHIRVA